MINEIFGAKALVYLKYDGDINSLADELSKGLVLPSFSLETKKDTPHDLFGSCEAFGFEGWLESSEEISGFGYTFKIETEHSLEESFNDKMHDLSLWLARYIFSICEIQTFVPADKTF